MSDPDPNLGPEPKPNPDPNPNPELERLPVLDPLRQNVPVSTVSFSPHCFAAILSTLPFFSNSAEHYEIVIEMWFTLFLSYV
jgi:hypothetical protein